MARSRYIYVITESSFYFTNGIVATFTVKHECISWMKRNPPEDTHAIRYLHRFNDGGGKSRIEMDYYELLESK